MAYEDVVCFDYWLCRDSAGRRFPKAEWRDIHLEFSRHVDRIEPVADVAGHLASLSKTSRFIWSRHGFPMHTMLRYRGWQRTASHTTASISSRTDRNTASMCHSSRQWKMTGSRLMFSMQWGFDACSLRIPWNKLGPCSPLFRCEDWPQVMQTLRHQG